MKISGVAGLLLWLGVAGFAQTNSYTVKPIVNNTQDAYLVNPWGISRPSSSSVGENEWWVSDEMTGFTTLYYAHQKGSLSLAPLGDFDSVGNRYRRRQPNWRSTRELAPGRRRRTSPSPHWTGSLQTGIRDRPALEGDAIGATPIRR